MPSLVRVTGPNHIYISFAGTAQYLGTCETVPTYEDKPGYDNVMNAISGVIFPFNSTYQGTEMILQVANLTRYDEAIFSSFRQSPYPRTANTLGNESLLSRGTLMYGAFTPQLIVQNQFFGTVNAVAGDLPGYRFLNAQYMGGTPQVGGTTENKYSAIFYCRAVYDTSTRGFTCYTNDNAISSLTPN